MRLIIYLPFSLAFSLAFLGCSHSAVLSRTQVIMGTFATIELDANHATAIENGFTHLKSTESILSSYQKNALVSQLNHKHTIPTHPLLKDILEKSIAYHARTLGYFDVTIGSITKKLYHFGEAERLPTNTELKHASLGIRNIFIDHKTIRLAHNTTIDLGGIGKGYAVDGLSSYYQDLGIKDGKIALSGDIRCLNQCEVSIQSPFEEQKIIAHFKSKRPNLSVSTSGSYRRYIEKKQHHHLINPKTKKQGRDFVSVTIVAHKNNILCDVMATAISTMPKNVALDFVKTQKDFGYLLVTPKGEIIRGNLDKFINFIDTH